MKDEPVDEPLPKAKAVDGGVKVRGLTVELLDVAGARFDEVEPEEGWLPLLYNSYAALRTLVDLLARGVLAFVTMLTKTQRKI